jgi:hypothetical protein
MTTARIVAVTINWSFSLEDDNDDDDILVMMVLSRATRDGSEAVVRTD